MCSTVIRYDFHNCVTVRKGSHYITNYINIVTTDQSINETSLEGFPFKINSKSLSGRKEILHQQVGWELLEEGGKSLGL